MYDDNVRQAARALHSTGWSINGVHRELGIARSTLREWFAIPESVGAACPAPAAPTPEYAALLGFYLGDGCLSRVRRTYALRVSCDATLPGIVADVERCTLAVHPERRTYRVTAPGVVVVQSYWNHWPCLFPQHGPGRKHERDLAMAPWQRAVVDEHPAAFLRGLFLSDGCRVNNWAPDEPKDPVGVDTSRRRATRRADRTEDVRPPSITDAQLAASVMLA